VLSAANYEPSRASKLTNAKNAIIKPWSYFSLQEMGLQDIVEEQDQVSSDGLTGFVGGIWRGIMSTVVGEAEPTPESALSTTLNAGPYMHVWIRKQNGSFYA
jgi:hypothetical protein